MNYFIIISLWFLFGFQHSLLARPFFKKLLRTIFGNFFVEHIYRFIYFLSQCVIFFFIWDLIINTNQGKIIFEVNQEFKWIIYLFYKASIIFLILSVLNFEIGEFIGVSQLISIFKKKKETQEILNKNLYKYCRHPMYLGILLVFIFSTSIYTIGYFINLVALIIYIEIGSYYEEKTLLTKYGLSYKKYQKTTYKYIPFLR